MKMNPLTNKTLRLGVAALMLVLAGFLSGQLVGGVPAAADQQVQYKVVSSKEVHTPEQYEKLLNDMAAQGWEFSHIIALADMVVFKR